MLHAIAHAAYKGRFWQTRAFLGVKRPTPTPPREKWGGALILLGDKYGGCAAIFTAKRCSFRSPNPFSFVEYADG